jgi:hypothetical protein
LFVKSSWLWERERKSVVSGQPLPEAPRERVGDSIFRGRVVRKELLAQPGAVKFKKLRNQRYLELGTNLNRPAANHKRSEQERYWLQGTYKTSRYVPRSAHTLQLGHAQASLRCHKHE